jgi:hypothetical protein
LGRVGRFGDACVRIAVGLQLDDLIDAAADQRRQLDMCKYFKSSFAKIPALKKSSLQMLSDEQLMLNLTKAHSLKRPALATEVMNNFRKKK